MGANGAAQYELVDVEVDRVDAVDRPATRRKWLILKSEEEDEEMVNVQELERRAMAVLDALAKEEGDGLPLSEDAVAALNALAKLLDFGATFKAAKKAKGGGEDEYGYPEPEGKGGKKRTTKAEDEAEPTQVEKAILGELRALREALERQGIAKSAGHPPSKQPQGEDRIEKSQPKKWGEGLFTDIVFGQ